MQVHTGKAICYGCGKASEKNILGVDGPLSIPERPWVVITVRSELYPGGKGFYVCSDECRSAVMKSVDKHIAGLFEELQLITLALQLGLEESIKLLSDAASASEKSSP